MSEAGRVIAGSARGTRLLAPGEGTRPMGDRVKQTLFAILEPNLPGAAVLDLFAGSGGGGIEALSRGAARAVFVERDVTAVRAIGDNLARAHVAERGRVVKGDAVGYLVDKAAADGRFDVVLVDPPYAETGLMEAALARLSPAILTTEAIVVAKHFWRTPPPEAVGLLASFRSKRFGETALTFYRRSDTAADFAPPDRRGGTQVKIAVYPGSFDPITFGHLDVVSRAAAVFDQVYFAVLVNHHKSEPVFATGERLAAIREAVDESCPPDVAARIAIESFDGLTVDFCRGRDATFIVRGLRAISDFESELQMAHTNRKLAPGIDTVFFMTALEHSYLSSSLVKEISAFGGDVTEMVPPAVVRRLNARGRSL